MIVDDMDITMFNELTQKMSKDGKEALFKEIFRLSLQDKEIVTKTCATLDDVHRMNMDLFGKAQSSIPDTTDPVLMAMKIAIDGHAKLYKQIVALFDVSEAIMLNHIEFRESMKEFMNSQTGSQKERDEKLSTLMTKMMDHDSKVSEIAERFGNLSEKLAKSEELGDWLKRYSNDVEADRI
jgi:hypothetical protein